MKIALHVTERVFQKWPEEYCAELTGKLLDKGHRVFFVGDKYPDENNRSVIDDSDVFIGAPSDYADYAKQKGKRVISLMGSTLTGDGVTSSIICAGCVDKNEGRMDCLWGDELCMYEITPNDVLGVL